MHADQLGRRQPLVGQDQGGDRTTNSGTGALSVAASDDSTCCSAQVISANGSSDVDQAHHRQMGVHARLARQRLARGDDDGTSSTKPMNSRSMISVNGVRPASTPILMNR